MKKLLMSLAVMLALLASQSSFADNRHYRGGYNHYRGGSYYNRHYSPSRYYRDSGYFSVSFGNHYGYRHGHYGSHDAGAFVGGLVLGSLISAPSYSYPRYETVRYVSRPVSRTVYIKEAVTRPAAIASGRRLLRDLEGNCFERVVDDNGDEIRVQLDASECAF